MLDGCCTRSCYKRSFRDCDSQTNGRGIKEGPQALISSLPNEASAVNIKKSSSSKQGINLINGSPEDAQATQLPNKSLYAWLNHTVTINALDPDVALMIALKTNYLLDIKEAK